MKMPPIPHLLSARPKDKRGYPIPFNALRLPDGTHDFRVIDEEVAARCLAQCRCGLCGERINGLGALIGGPISHQSRMFLDPPMHKDCALFAVQVCPFLGAPRFRYAESIEHDGVALRQVAVNQPSRPDKFFVGVTPGWRLVRHGDTTLIHASPWLDVSWWRGGAPLPK